MLQFLRVRVGRSAAPPRLRQNPRHTQKNDLPLRTPILRILYVSASQRIFSPTSQSFTDRCGEHLLRRRTGRLSFHFTSFTLNNIETSSSPLVRSASLESKIYLPALFINEHQLDHRSRRDTRRAKSWLIHVEEIPISDFVDFNVAHQELISDQIDPLF